MQSPSAAPRRSPTRHDDLRCRIGGAAPDVPDCPAASFALAHRDLLAVLEPAAEFHAVAVDGERHGRMLMGVRYARE
jgi:hypothetical protein